MGFLFFGACSFLFLMMLVAGKAIAGILLANAKAEEAILTDPGQARRIRIGLKEGVLHRVANFFMFFVRFVFLFAFPFMFGLFSRACSGGFGKARNVVIAKVARRD